MTKYVKSFSHGHITIPKKMREALNLGEEFWLKLSLDGNKLIAEPAEKKISGPQYAKQLKKVKGGWISKQEVNKNRKITEQRFKDLKW